MMSPEKLGTQVTFVPFHPFQTQTRENLYLYKFCGSSYINYMYTHTHTNTHTHTYTEREREVFVSLTQ